MSEKEYKRALLVDKRARALTTMLLARREDLLIEEVKDDIGLDYVVRFHTKSKEGLREFGIALRGAWPAATKDHTDQLLRLSLKQIKHYGPFLQPVCLFLFTMEDDGSWYTWVTEPIESANENPRLRLCDEPDRRQLDKRALKEIIERVDEWYDAIFLDLIANGASKVDRKKSKQ